MMPFSGFAKGFGALLTVLAAAAGCCGGYTPSQTIPPPTPATPSCTMVFTSPSSGAALAASGPVDFTWTAVANASFYLLSLDVPGGVGKTTFTVNGTKRTLYMDSFQVGSFSAQVQARNADNDILCQATLQFSTKAPDPKTKKEPPPGPGVPPPPPPK